MRRRSAQNERAFLMPPPQIDVEHPGRIRRRKPQVVKVLPFLLARPSDCIRNDRLMRQPKFQGAVRDSLLDESIQRVNHSAAALVSTEEADSCSRAGGDSGRRKLRQNPDFHKTTRSYIEG